MSSESKSTQTSKQLLAWGQLVRLPTVFTVIANVSAAFLLFSGGPAPVNRFFCVLVASIFLYWAGMILNDLFDIECDGAERPGRPLPSGMIHVNAARAAGWGLLLLGVGLGTLSGFLPSDTNANTWLPAAISALLAIMIVAYDGPLKRTPLGPLAMGLCRLLSFLLGAAPLIVITDQMHLDHQHVIAIALGFGIYVMGITNMARDEASVSSSQNTNVGLLVMAIGAAALAFAPQTANQRFDWFLSPKGQFPLLVGLIVFPVLMRGLRATRMLSPHDVQMTVRSAILTIIPLSAAVALMGAGPVWGLTVFALFIPSLALSAKFRVT